MVQRCGYVAIIGLPNAGKSTLLNALLGNKISIVTPKPQTTRFPVRGILMHGETQLILIDTPGLLKAKSKLDEAMRHSIEQQVKDADSLLILLDGKEKLPLSIQEFLGSVPNKKKIFVINKIDAAKTEKQIELAKKLQEIAVDSKIIAVSALKGDNVEDLKNYMAANMPEAPWLFPEEQLTDLEERWIAAEITREKLFLNLSDEIPYHLHVQPESWEDFRNGDVKLSQTILIPKESQKPILLGKGGHMIKKIREDAQQDISKMLGRKAHLFLHIKIRENWMQNPSLYKEMGLEFPKAKK